MEDRLAKDIAAVRADSTKTPEPTKVTLTEEKEPDRVAAIANAVNLDGPSTPEAHAATPPPAAGGSDEPDKAAIQQALSHAANMALMCARPGGDSGPGKANVTFGPNGRPQSVSVQGKLAGTPTGDCVVKQFQLLKIAPFSGGPVTVAKMFLIPD